MAIWPKDIHHHDTMGGVWGAGKLGTGICTLICPMCRVWGQDGLKLIEMVKAGARGNRGG